jgi:hypothetical protein
VGQLGAKEEIPVESLGGQPIAHADNLQEVKIDVFLRWLLDGAFAS